MFSKSVQSFHFVHKFTAVFTYIFVPSFFIRIKLILNSCSGILNMKYMKGLLYLRPKSCNSFCVSKNFYCLRVDVGKCDVKTKLHSFCHAIYLDISRYWKFGGISKLRTEKSCSGVNGFNNKMKYLKFHRYTIFHVIDTIHYNIGHFIGIRPIVEIL